MTRSLTIGRVTLRVSTDFDDNPDYSWLGRYVHLRDVRTAEYVYDRKTDSVRAPGSDLWRNRKGQIVSNPDLEEYSREYRYIANDNGYDRNAHMFQDADRLNGLDRGDWHFIGIVARVTFNNHEIGSSSVWGFESDSGRDYIASEARNIALDALSDAKLTRDALTWDAS